MKSNKIKIHLPIGRGIKRALCVGMLGGVICFAAGCGESGPELTTADSVANLAGTIQLYHVEDSSIVADSGRYQLKQPDNVPAMIEELIEEMNIDPALSIERYYLDEDGNVSLDIILTDDITKEALLLNKAVIVKNMQGLDIGDVQLRIQTESGGMVETATYTDSSFYYFEDED